MTSDDINVVYLLEDSEKSRLMGERDQNLIHDRLSWRCISDILPSPSKMGLSTAGQLVHFLCKLLRCLGNCVQLHGRYLSEITTPIFRSTTRKCGRS